MKNLYQWTKNSTNDFREIPPEIILRKPGTLRIFRILLNKGQIPFAKMLGVSQSTLSALERGLDNVLREEELRRIGLIISKQKYEVLSLEAFSDRINKISIQGRFSGEYARRMAEKSAPKAAVKSAQAKKPTAQEQQMADCFKENGIRFEKQSAIDVGGITFVVDFAIPDATNPRIIIEAKDLRTRYRKKASICELAYKSIKIKQKYACIKTIAVVNGNLTRTEQAILVKEFDKLLYNSSLERLISQIGCGESGLTR